MRLFRFFTELIRSILSTQRVKLCQYALASFSRTSGERTSSDICSTGMNFLRLLSNLSVGDIGSTFEVLSAVMKIGDGDVTVTKFCSARMIGHRTKVSNRTLICGKLHCETRLLRLCTHTTTHADLRANQTHFKISVISSHLLTLYLPTVIVIDVGRSMAKLTGK